MILLLFHEDGAISIRDANAPQMEQRRVGPAIQRLIPRMMMIPLRIVRPSIVCRDDGPAWIRRSVAMARVEQVAVEEEHVSRLEKDRYVLKHGFRSGDPVWICASLITR